MTKTEFADFTNDQLVEEKKKIQHNKAINATLVGICVGIFIYSAVYNGFGFFTFFPLLLIYPFIRNGKKTALLEAELKARSL